MPLETLKARIDALPTPSTRVQRAVAIAVVVTQALIAVTGSVVRVTGSGLGCSTWPQCQPGSLVPVSHPEFAALNQWIEFGNRLLTGVVGIVAFAAFALAYLARPRRARYLRLALAMPVGVVVQAVLGGLTVRFDLLWWTVAVHFLVSAVMVWLAVMLVDAVDPERAATGRVRVPSALPGLLTGSVVVLVGLLVAGTMVTGAGPHAGDPETPRLAIPVETLAHVHAAFLFVYLGMLLAAGVLLRVGGSDRALWRRYGALVAVVVAQGALGFVQFWTGVPELLVSLHVLGAMAVVAATSALWCATRDRAAVAAPAQPVPA
ncbi:COX15/CtaA family protein [Actinokineospora globicatena]|uniref:COX15/CtaA family protein n=1 Tax=Actinokineospora globicatena TaxID=103729 RepID=UPI0020A3DCE3|nr:COX15/CtaA family protein [Actinokineospora globicatena]MCP2304820.1 cytochrome c oxidase assembly protein subunit 15 [Actinokineospora globicatena]GLW77802.1 cytochrome-c oxidase [Actinokineospora globicatena]GLW85530.1 cytochrome-c oxidase [Actinokineospora globicatena]